MGLRYKKANVTHPELGVTVQLPIISVNTPMERVLLIPSTFINFYNLYLHVTGQEKSSKPSVYANRCFN